MNKTGPTINRGGSKQDYPTPPEFIAAVVARFGEVSFDLAASPENTKAEHYFTEEHDSLKQIWHDIAGNLWLNPPFANIEPWAAKCVVASKMGAKIYMLVPASVGTNWYQEFVEPHAYVLGLNPRITFVGCKDAYPKDLMLCCYLYGLTGFKTWRWK